MYSSRDTIIHDPRYEPDCTCRTCRRLAALRGEGRVPLVNDCDAEQPRHPDGRFRAIEVDLS